MYLYGKHRSRREVESRVGKLQQIGGMRRYQLQEGKGGPVILPPGAKQTYRLQLTLS